MSRRCAVALTSQNINRLLILIASLAKKFSVLENELQTATSKWCTIIANKTPGNSVRPDETLHTGYD